MLPVIPPALIRKVIYPTYRALRRDKLLSVLLELERDQWLPREEIEQLQWQRLSRLLEEISQHVPYYRDMFSSLSMRAEDVRTWDDFRKIPFLTKEIIREQAARLITGDGKRKGAPSSTGGSTGEPLYFYVDKESGLFRRANGIRVARWLGADIGDRQALLWGLHLGQSIKERFSEALRNWATNTLYLSSFDMSESSIETYLEKLRRFRPRILTGYPSALTSMAEYCRSNAKKVPGFQAIVTSGEMLFPHQRELLEDVFSSPVFDRYGCREFAGIAQQCERRQGLHVFTDLLVVELIHESGREARSGEAGEVVVTDLFNYYMPFVRYKIQDMAVASEGACSCGRGLPVLQSIEGRSFDVVITPSGKSVGGFFWTWLSRSVPGIEGFQIEQDRLDGIVFRIVRGALWRDEYAANLESRIKENCGADFSVKFEFVEKIPLTSTGKLRFISSKIGPR